LPTTIGEDAPRPGSETFQARFFSFDHDRGTDFSGLMPSPSTPRQQAQNTLGNALQQKKSQYMG
jgi:hypothetical protein